MYKNVDLINRFAPAANNTTLGIDKEFIPDEILYGDENKIEFDDDDEEDNERIVEFAQNPHENKMIEENAFK